MARIEIDPNYSSPTFSRATAGTDLFKKEDVQALAAAMSTHDHSTGKGLALAAGAIPSGSITSAMIADGTIVAGDIADGTITSLKIADGTIATADLANASVTNAKLASDTARDNLLTNGGFEIWQRGTSFSSITTDTFHADNWHTSPGAGSSFTTVQRTPTAGFTDGSPFSYGATYVHSASSNVFQKIEGFGSLVGRTVSLSIRVRTTTANAVRLFLNDSVAGYNSSYHTGGDTWQTLTLTATIASNATSIVLGINLTASATFYADNAMLVVGSVPADYAPLHPADDLARCQRYYELLGAGAAGDLIVGGIASVGSQAGWLSMNFKTEKAVTPTVTILGTWATTNAGAPTPVGYSSRGVRIQTLSAGAGTFYALNSNAGTYVSVEANP